MNTRPITKRTWLGLAMVIAGVAALLVAPMAQVCVVDGDSRACETIGTIGLQLAGGVMIAVGGLLVVLGRGHKIAA